MMISVGDTNSAAVTSIGKSSKVANTCHHICFFFKERITQTHRAKADTNNLLQK
jgi:hypothetical protein